MKKKVVIFIDTIAAKNKLQLDILQRLDYIPVCFISFKKENTDNYFKIGQQTLLQPGFAGRLKQVYAYFRQNRKSIHHVEIYPGGRFSFIYLFLSKYFGIPSICAERGDLLYYNKKNYSLPVKASMFCCYKFSDIVWYREPYMKPILDRIRKSGLFFLHNAIHTQPFEPFEFEKKDIDFLWLNRVIPERKSKWFLDVLKSEAFQHTKSYLVGIQNDTAFNNDVEYVYQNVPANLDLVPYTSNPEFFFKRAKFFVLPADVVFANHALLEAMSYGAVPIVSNIGSATLIVENEQQGFLFKHDYNSFKAAMEAALHIPKEKYTALSLKSMMKIESNFSEHSYAQKLKELYRLLD